MVFTLICLGFYIGQREVFGIHHQVCRVRTTRCFGRWGANKVLLMLYTYRSFSEDLAELPVDRDASDASGPPRAMPLTRPNLHLYQSTLPWDDLSPRAPDTGHIGSLVPILENDTDPQLLNVCTDMQLPWGVGKGTESELRALTAPDVWCQSCRMQQTPNFSMFVLICNYPCYHGMCAREWRGFFSWGYRLRHSVTLHVMCARERGVVCQGTREFFLGVLVAAHTRITMRSV